MDTAFLKLDQPDTANICATCGTRFSKLPVLCPVCADERQYLPHSGQAWISYRQLAQDHSIRITPLNDFIFELIVTPSFAIAQRALLVMTSDGNFLWDCLPFLDEETISFIQSKGGLQGIAISHPHYYGLMAVWAKTFECPLHLHSLDNTWVMEETHHLQSWSGSQYRLTEELEMIHTGGHFAGSCIMAIKKEGHAGILLVGDSLQVARSGGFVSIMYSYPNLIPLPHTDVLTIFERVNRLHFDAIYGAFPWQNLHAGAKGIVVKSAAHFNAISK